MSDRLGRNEVAELLPWYVAGTLDARDRNRVEAALARDATLALELNLIREEMDAAVHLNETLGTPSARAMAELFARIDGEPARPRRGARDLWARVSGMLADMSPRALAWTAAAAALAIVLQAGVIADLVVNGPRAGSYHTASTPDDNDSGGTYALVRFAPDASLAETTAFLQRNKLSIAGGPAPGGLYRIRLTNAVMAPDEVTRLVERLRQDRIVSFIGPAG
jgi:hypothetical protein